MCYYDLLRLIQNSTRRRLKTGDTRTVCLKTAFAMKAAPVALRQFPQWHTKNVRGSPVTVYWIVRHRHEPEYVLAVSRDMFARRLLLSRCLSRFLLYKTRHYGRPIGSTNSRVREGSRLPNKDWYETPILAASQSVAPKETESILQAEYTHTKDFNKGCP